MDFWQDVFSAMVERPLVLIGLAILPLAPLAFWAGIYPTRRLAAAACVPAFLSLAMLFWPESGPAILTLDALLVVVAALDLFLLPLARQFSASRVAGRIASQGKPHDVEITLDNRSRRGLHVELADDCPGEFVCEPREFSESIGARSRAVFAYRFRSSQRGVFQLECVHVKTTSRLGLWHRFLRLPAPGEIHVYPDMKQLGEYELLARTNRLSLLGLRRTRRIGSENEFERLRDYTIDDDHRHIDWRATARRQELTVRDFQANQNQQLVFLVDCGRMMTGQSRGVPLLDRTFNALLMLSWIALSRGDSVGLILFADRVVGYTPPRSGTGQVNRLLHATYDQFARYSESRFDEAFLYLDQKVRKRSLVVLVTNLMDEVNARIVKNHLRVQTGRHLPLAVFLRDHDLYDQLVPAASPSPGDHAAALDRRATAVAAAGIVAWREQSIAELANHGILTLDAKPEELTAEMVNRYLEIKARGLL
jgi:uncharacterized protein (DUF58 family)